MREFTCYCCKKTQSVPTGYNLLDRGWNFALKHVLGGSFTVVAVCGECKGTLDHDPVVGYFIEEEIENA